MSITEDMIQKLFGLDDGSDLVAMDVVWSLEHISARYLLLH